MIDSYPWLRLVDIRVPKDGEYVLLSDGNIVQAIGYVGLHPVVIPLNAYNVIRLEDLKIPAGYEYDGETLKDAFRVPSLCHAYLTSIGSTVGAWEGSTPDVDCRRLCLRKIKPKAERFVVLESNNPDTVAFYEGKSAEAVWKVRIEERPIVTPCGVIFIHRDEPFPHSPAKYTCILQKNHKGDHSHNG